MRFWSSDLLDGVTFGPNLRPVTVDGEMDADCYPRLSSGQIKSQKAVGMFCLRLVTTTIQKARPTEQPFCEDAMMPHALQPLQAESGKFRRS